MCKLTKLGIMNSGNRLKSLQGEKIGNQLKMVRKEFCKFKFC